MSIQLIGLLLALRIISLPYAVSAMAIEAGVDPRLASCVVTWESAWDTTEISTSGAVGLFQIMPETAKWAAGKLGIEHYDLMNPVDNTVLGLYILQTNPRWFLVYEWCE